MCGVLRGMVPCGETYKDKDKERTKKMKAEIKIGDWYYRMMGYGGSESQYCCVRRKTGKQTGAGMVSLFNGTGRMQPIPVSDIYEAVDECGVVHQVSANDLAANGHIGIGTLEEPKYGHVASICREDARLLVETGKYTDVEIMAAFPYAFGKYEDEAEANAGKTEPMTDVQEEILKAAYAANCEKKKRELEESNRKFREAVERTRKELSYIPCKKEEGKYLTVGEKRRNVLAVLKHEFPGVKFSVHTRNGSTSDSVTVEYEDGPAKGDVERVVNQFEETEYNAYEDYHAPRSTAVTAVCGGFDYAFVERKYSKDVYGFIREWLFANVGGCDKEFANGTATRVSSMTALPVGGYELEGMELDEKDGWRLVVRAVKPAPQKPTPTEQPRGNGVEIRYNEEKNGIEISFPSVPSESVRNLCKACGFRWSRFNKVWYCGMSDRAVAAAEQIAAQWEDENKTAA